MMPTQNALLGLFGSLPPAVSRDRIENTLASLGGFGLRQNGTPKGMGYYGPLLRKDGISTELSAGFEIDGKEVEVPLLVPGLSTDELNWLLNTPNDAPDYFQKMPRSILDKAYSHAVSRIRAQKSPFAD